MASTTFPPTAAQVEALKHELRDVGQELANSIRREIELEDELERLKFENQTNTDANKRTSDYYSDSNASSTRFPIGDSDQRIEELERIRRKVEQDKAQQKAEMAQKLHDEMVTREAAERQVQELEEQLRRRSKDQLNGTGQNERVRELESAQEIVRRKLLEEREARANFEDLFAALRGETEQLRNERDNLKEEVVPQLRTQIEGLEAGATDFQSLTYEHSRLQQELQRLNSNSTNQQSEDTDTFPLSPMSSNIGVSRSKSLARGGRARSSTIAQGGALVSRSNSTAQGITPTTPTESLNDRVKDVEAQRDALHKALKMLLDRQAAMDREHSKRLKQLEKERDEALTLTPRRTKFGEEVKHLREEIKQLRRRADDALEQKWQCEKGLGGLKQDLDRAKQETGSLRDLLQEHDIFVPERRGSDPDLSEAATQSLDKAYKELQATQLLSLAHIKELENDDGTVSGDAPRILTLLKQSISDAEAERDIAQREAQLYRSQARALQRSEVEHLTKEQTLASQLYASASRMDELAAQVQSQLQANKQLKEKLAAAIERGEGEQSASAGRIAGMQGKLHELEGQILTAQQHSEDTIFSHEAEMKTLLDAHNEQLSRVKAGVLLSPTRFAAPAQQLLQPLTPLFGGARSPRLDRTTSGLGISLEEATRTEVLEQKVVELEAALRGADREMEEVVGRMNAAQIEVAELQAQKYVPYFIFPLSLPWRSGLGSPLAQRYGKDADWYCRDEAMMRTRRLQAEMVKEREKVKALMS